MAGQKRTITGPVRHDTQPNGTTSGTGYRIGDGFTLTAGHVVYEWNRDKTPDINDIIDGSNTIVSDYRGYRAAYLAAALQQSAMEKAGVNIPNGNGEIEAGLVRRDSVVISGGGNIGANADGLVVFLSPSDLTNPSAVLSGASVLRDGNTTGLVSGTVHSASNGQLTFTPASNLGDSGGAYLLRFNGRDYVIGTQSAQNFVGGVPSGNAYGTYFTYGEWTSLNQLVATNVAAGDVTDTDPTNLLVGTGGGDTAATGSFRADIILGLGGDDTLRDGELISDARYGRDQLFGGAGDDKLYATAGKDLLHGGDHPRSATVTALDDDGIDETSYEALGIAVTVKLATTPADTTFNSVITANQAVWVEHAQGNVKVHDTLVSIEKIITGATTDTVQIDDLAATFLAGTDDKGGLVEIDLGESPTGREHGDHVDATKMTDAIKIDLKAGRIELKDDSDVGFKITKAERVTGGEGNDELTGDDQENVIKGGKGDDKIKGGGGRDLLEGGEGADEIEGEAEDDELKGDAGNDTLRGGAGNDTLDGGADDDTLIGGAGLDIFIGGDGADILDGATDDDDQAEILNGGAGQDTYYGGQGDTIQDIDQPDAVFVVAGGGGSGFAAAAAAGGTPKRLTGGERERPPEDPCGPPTPDDDEDESGTYEGADGTIYAYDKDSGNLSVTSGGVAITITGFSNGEAGIQLRSTRPDQEQAECQRDPLIIDLNGDRQVVEELYDSQAYFDLANDGFAEHVAWALPEDGLLAIDRDGDGLITSGLELFGTGRTSTQGNTPILEGTDGFTELAAFDSNNDRRIDAADARFLELRVWQDANGDAITDGGELKTLAELGIASISLQTSASDDLDCGCDGTEVVSMAQVTRADGTYTGIYDAFLSIDQYDSRELAPIAVSEAAAALPELLGSGSLSALRVAMSGDPALLEMVEALAALDISEAGELFARTEAILLRWTGADQVDVDSRGPNINARWLVAMERITGSDFSQALIGANPRQDAASMMTVEWQDWVVDTAAKLLGQIALGEVLTPGLSFAAAAFFVIEDGTSLDDVLAGIAASAPADPAAAIAHWHVMLNIVSRYRSEFGMTSEEIDGAAEPYLEPLGLSPADVRAAIVGSGASGLVSGTHGTLNTGDGRDLLIALDGVEQMDGGASDDSYWLGAGVTDVRINDGDGRDRLILPIGPDEVELLLASNALTTEVSLTSNGVVIARFDIKISSAGVSTTIEEVVFADGSSTSVPDLLYGRAIDTGDGGAIVLGRQWENSTLIGGAGDDLLLGFAGDDEYQVGPAGGDDQVVENGASGFDRVIVAAQRDDVVFSGEGSGDILLRFQSTGAVVRILNQRNIADREIEEYHFSDGTVVTLAQVDQLLNTGGPADDVLYGSVRDDVMTGGGGDDLLRGGSGVDTYLFAVGEGSDRIEDADVGNIVHLSGLTLNDVTFERGGSAGRDIVMRVAASGETLTVARGLNAPIVTMFEFDDGSFATIDVILQWVTGGVAFEIGGTDRNDRLDGTFGEDTLNGGAGDDYLDGGDGEDIYVFSSGRDEIYDSGTGSDTLLAPYGATIADLRILRNYGQIEIAFRGFEGSVVLNNQFEADSPENPVGLWGKIETIAFWNGVSLRLGFDERQAGTAGDDLLFDTVYEERTYTPGTGNDVILSGMGDDRILIEPGFGDIVVADLSGSDDRIVFVDPTVTGDRIILGRDGENLVIQVAGETGSVTIEGHLAPYASTSDHGSFEQIEFADGSTLSKTQILERLSQATSGDDWIATGIRDGGAGNDLLIGDNGADAYVFAAGYGNDTIIDYGWDTPEDYPWTRYVDTVTFAGLGQDEVAFTRAPGDPHSVLATIIATGETLLIDRSPSNSARDEQSRRYMIEEFVFEDGSILKASQVFAQILAAERTAGDDVLTGFGIDTVVDGGGGNDHITLNSGGSVLLAPGGGEDVVRLVGGFEDFTLLVRGAGPEDLLIRPVFAVDGVRGDHVRFELPDGSAVTILFAAQSTFVGEGTAVPLRQIAFEGGDTFFYDGELGGLISGRTVGTAGDDGLTGQFIGEDRQPANDRFLPGPGNDIIAGNGGNDTIVFGPGMGNDIAVSNPGSNWKFFPANFTIEMLPGVGMDNIVLRWSEEQLGMVAIGFVDAPDVLLVAPEALAGIRFADGSRLIVPQSGDYLSAGAGETIESGSGDDFVEAYQGDVTLVFERGDGSDTLSDPMFDWIVAGFEEMPDWYAGSRLRLADVASVDDLLLARNGASDDLTIIVRDTGERVQVVNQFGGAGVAGHPTLPEAVITQIELAGGTVLDWADLQLLVEDVDPDTIPVIGDPSIGIIDFESLSPPPSDDAETLLLSPGGSVDSLGGNDRIVALGPDVTFYWSPGDGDDRFEAMAGSDFGGWSGTVIFEEIWSPVQLQFLRSGTDAADLVIVNRDTGERLTVVGQFALAGADAAEAPPVGQFQFASGEWMTWTQLYRLVEGVDDGDDDYIDGDDGGSTLDGGTGDDILAGGIGDDLHVFGRAYDEDRVRDAGGRDAIQFGEGLTPGTVFFSRTGPAGADLLIEVTGRDRLALTIEGQFGEESRLIETFAFADGSRLSWNDVEQLILRNEATGDDDMLTGFRSVDRIAGLAGNDSIEGGGGDDRIDGGTGRDVAIFSGARQDYEITSLADGSVQVRDSQAGRDGTDLLDNIEELRFRGDPAGTPNLDIVAPNRAPVVALLTIAGVEDEIIGIQIADLLAQASDADGDLLSVTGILGTEGGTAWILGGVLRFRPDADWTGGASFTYQVSDPNGGWSVGRVDILLAGTPDGPRATIDPASRLTYLEGDLPGIVAIVTASDPDGGPVSYAIVGGNEDSLFAVDAAGRIVTTRVADDADVGVHDLALRVTDQSGAIASLAVAVEIGNVNDAPVVASVTATLTEEEGFGGQIAASDADAGAVLHFSLDEEVTGLTLSADGLWSFDAYDDRYQSLGAGEEMVIVAAFTVTDDAGAQSRGELTLTVRGVNDAPIAALGLLDTELEEGDTQTEIARIVASDIDSARLGFDFSAGNDGGFFAIDDAGVITTTRSADDGEVGVHDLEVTVSDGAGGQAVMLLQIVVAGIDEPPILRVPVVDQTWQGGQAVDFALPAGTFTDPEGSALALTATQEDGSALPSWLVFDAATGRFTGTAPASSEPLSIRVTASDGSETASDVFVASVTPQQGNGGSSAGFSLHALNSWYNPQWGGGYNLTFRYVVQQEAIVDGQLKLWDIVADYSGLGTVSGGWVDSFGGPTNRTVIGSGDGLLFSTVGTSYQPDLKAGDTFYLSLRVDGAAFELDDFAFTIFDRDPPPNRADLGDARIIVGPTNDWGSGLSQNVSIGNVSGQRIEGWSVVLDLPDGVTFDLTTVWGATATLNADGDILFTAVDWNQAIGAGGQVNFGFVAQHPGAPAMSLTADMFTFA